ncbi:MAG: hypothetical protein QXZ44_03100 [Ferroplasma sp.]
MNNEYQKFILERIFDFFQYPENYDKIIMEASMNNIEYDGTTATFNKISYNIGNPDKYEGILGFYLANLPLLLIKKHNIEYKLPARLEKLRDDTYDLIALKKFNELATLDLYLLIEMSLRCSYSKWLGNEIRISDGQRRENIIKNYDYRQLKLYIRRNRLNSRELMVNGEPFPGSQTMLLRWASRFTDRNTGLLFRLSLNVRNLLAHGENEWSLYPAGQSVDIASEVAGKMLQNARVGTVEKYSNRPRNEKNRGNIKHFH